MYQQRSLKKPDKPSSSLDTSGVTDLCEELLMGSTKVHINHLLVTGTGSFAAHKAMNEFYDEVKSQADTIIEAYQGATEKLLPFSGKSRLTIMKSVEDCLDYLRSLYTKVDQVQKICQYTEIINELDGVKLLIDSTKYKLIFLQ